MATKKLDLAAMTSGLPPAEKPVLPAALSGVAPKPAPAAHPFATDSTFNPQELLKAGKVVPVPQARPESPAAAPAPAPTPATIVPRAKRVPAAPRQRSAGVPDIQVDAAKVQQVLAEAAKTSKRAAVEPEPHFIQVMQERLVPLVSLEQVGEVQNSDLLLFAMYVAEKTVPNLTPEQLLTMWKETKKRKTVRQGLRLRASYIKAIAGNIGAE